MIGQYLVGNLICLMAGMLIWCAGETLYIECIAHGAPLPGKILGWFLKVFGTVATLYFTIQLWALSV